MKILFATIALGLVATSFAWAAMRLASDADDQAEEFGHDFYLEDEARRALHGDDHEQ